MLQRSVAKNALPHDDGETMSLNADPLWKRRFQIERLIREFFWSLHYTETRTPLLVESPGMEPHLKPMQMKRESGKPEVFLPTSPEFAMKKLLARGLERIFQICPAFRDEPNSPEHHPEFTMLEFYEAHLPLDGLQNRVESLFQHLTLSLHGLPEFTFRGRRFRTDRPWRRIRVVDAFQDKVGIDLRTHTDSMALHRVCERHGLPSESTESWDDLYFKLWLNLVEPALPENELFFVTHYPLSQSSLCNPIADETGFLWANRFEAYAGRIELGNAFDELRDPEKQRRNFEKDQRIRKEAYGDRFPASPIDEEFIRSISLMPPVSGIAMGVDRLCMILLDARTIDEILPLQSRW
jgi:lysyl-tRNA synthetase class 2